MKTEPTGFAKLKKDNWNDRVIRSEECIDHERMLTEITWFSAGLSIVSQVWISFGINILGIFGGYLAYCLCKKNWRGLVLNIFIFILKVIFAVIMLM